MPRAAATYGGPHEEAGLAQPRLAERVRAAIADISSAAHRPPPLADSRLDRAATALADLALDGVPSDRDTRTLFAHLGVLESSRVVIQRFGADELAGWDELEVRLRAELAPTDRVVGVGVAERTGARVVVVTRQRGALDLAAFPRELAVGQSAILAGRLADDLTGLGVLATQVDGEVVSVPIQDGGGGAFRSEVRCVTPGTLGLRIVARDGDQKDVLVADVPIYCGEAPPEAPIAASTTITALETELLARANRDRQDHGLPPLVWDPAASMAARQHAEVMRDREVVSHELPGAGTLAEHAQKQGLVAPLILQNVARAGSAEDAEASLMGGRASRENLLSPVCTHAGIGIALSRTAGSSREAPQIYVAELLYAGVAPPAPDAAHAAVFASVDSARRAARLPPLAEDAGLDTIAQHAAERLAAGSPYPIVATHIETELAALPRLLHSIVIVHGVTADLGAPELKANSLISDRHIIGVGVARATGRFVGSLVVTLVVASVM